MDHWKNNVKAGVGTTQNPEESAELVNTTQKGWEGYERKI